MFSLAKLESNFASGKLYDEFTIIIVRIVSGKTLSSQVFFGLGYREAKIVRILSGLSQAVQGIFGYDISGKEIMGIEALGSIGSAMGSVASGIGKVSAGAGPAMANLGEAMKAPLGNIINEGPVRGGILEGFRPMNISDLTTINTGGTAAPSSLGEILFKSPSVPVVISQAETVAAAAWKANELPTPAQPVLEAESIQAIAEAVEPRMIKEATYWFTDIPGPRVIKPAEVIMPKIEPMAMPMVAPLQVPNIVEFPKPQPQIQTRTENRVSAAPTQASAVLPQPAPAEQEVEEIVEEKKERQKPKERLEEAEEIESQMYLEDENASAQRRIEVRTAVVKASLEADRLGWKNIAGWLVAKFLPGEHEGNRSQVVKKTGPDGSYQETIEAITGAGEFESGEKAVERFDGIVAEKKPVKYGKNGNPVGNIDIARVFKYRLIKPIQAYEEVVKRVIKKKVPVSQAPAPSVVTEKKEIKVEPNLQEISPALAGVFKKAA